MDPQNSTPENIQILSNQKNEWYENDWVGYAAFGLCVIFFINLLALDYLTFFQPKTSQSIQYVSSNSLLSPPVVTPNPAYCPSGCIDMFLQATSSAQPSVQQISNVSPTQTPTPTLTQTPTPTPTSSPNEYFIPFGYGSGNYTSWTSIPGLGASVNTFYYSNISTVVFEATVWIPTGNQTVQVQLYNANTYQAVSNSQMTVTGSVPTLVTTPISLSPGNNFYQVQLTTQLGYTTYIQQARLRIQTN